MTESITRPVCVDLTNRTDHLEEDVQFALSGLAYIAGTLISIGETGLVTHNVAGWERFIDTINASLADPGTFSRLEELHPTIGTLIDETESYKDTEYFEHFLNQLIDPMYRLQPIPSDDSAHYELSLIGW